MNLTIQFKTPYNSEADGLTVEWWPMSDFLHAPVSTDAYPPAASPGASGVTSGGACTLTGLSAVDGWVSIIDKGNKPNFRFVPASYIGGGTFTFRYTPASYPTPATIVYTPYLRAALIGPHAITTATLVPWDTETAENGTTIVLNFVTNAVDAPVDAYYNVNAHVDFQAGAAKFVAGDLLTVSLYRDATLLSSTTVAPPTGATKFSVEVTDTNIGGAYTAVATLTTVAGTTVTALAGSHMTVQALPNIVLGS